MATCELKNGVLLIRLAVVPKSSRDAVAGLLGEEIKLAITAPPVDGKANAHIAKLLGKWFKTAKSNVEIVKGETGRHKVVVIKDYKEIPEDFKPFMPSES